MLKHLPGFSGVWGPSCRRVIIQQSIAPPSRDRVRPRKHEQNILSADVYINSKISIVALRLTSFLLSFLILRLGISKNIISIRDENYSLMHSLHFPCYALEWAESMHIQYITYLGLHCPSHHGMHVTVSWGHGIRKCEPSVFDNFDNFVLEKSHTSIEQRA